MITHIRMKNFKSWKDSGEVKLAPLTGFFGTNSSGKSSLLQMLLLLKQTAERSNSDEVIFFGDETSYANLGNFNEVIHGHIIKEKLEFEFGCKLQEPLIITQPNNFQDVTVKTYSFIFNTSIQEQFTYLLVPNLSYTINDPINMKIIWSGKEINYVGLDTVDLINIHEDSSQKNCYGVALPNKNFYFFHFTSAFEELFSHVFYLGPIRHYPQRFYHWEGSHPKDIGRRGDKTIDALLSARIDQKTILDEEEEKSIEEKISDWLREMNLAYTFSLERIDSKDGKDYEVRIQQKENGSKHALADMGFGLSQFLPVLVLCYYAPKGSTLILEQPGIHLHPMAQSQLADLFIEVITERKLQILVESHSEHLLTRLQLRIAEEKISNDKTALYFCQNENGTSNITPLKLDEFGNITNWPKDFFGNVRGDLTKMTREQIKRKKEAEG